MQAFLSKQKEEFSGFAIALQWNVITYQKPVSCCVDGLLMARMVQITCVLSYVCYSPVCQMSSSMEILIIEMKFQFAVWFYLCSFIVVKDILNRKGFAYVLNLWILN